MRIGEVVEISIMLKETIKIIKAPIIQEKMAAGPAKAAARSAPNNQPEPITQPTPDAIRVNNNLKYE